MFAIVSDIHSNLEALEMCLADVATRNVKDIICLGDIIGYGPNPRECLKLAMKFFRFSLIGNHEEAVMMIAEDFNDRARQAVEWTRAQLNDKNVPREERHAFWNYLDKLQKLEKVEKGKFMFVHGSPRVPTKEYIMPRDTHDPAKLKAIFDMVPQILFCGHSHVPGVYTEELKYIHPSKMPEGKFVFPKDKKVIVNCGSVGQPRDQDPRACYVTFNEEYVQFHRVFYNVNTVVEKIQNSGGLPQYLADRLREGR